MRAKGYNFFKKIYQYRILILRQRFEQGQGVDIFGNFHDIDLIIPRLVGGIENPFAVRCYARVNVTFLPLAGAGVEA